MTTRWQPGESDAAGARRSDAEPADLGLDADGLRALEERARKDVSRYDDVAAQLAVARHGRLAFVANVGRARFADGHREARGGDLFATFSVTKAIVASACWLLLQEGRLDLSERAADIVPRFGENGKQDITVEHLLTHTAGLPSARIDPLRWDAGDERLEVLAGWRPEWEPGSRFVYHGGSGMWVLAEILTRRSGMDFRRMIRSRILEPLGLGRDLFLGLPAEQNVRVAAVTNIGEAHRGAETGISPVDAPAIDDDALTALNRPEWRAVGMPGGGAIASAAAVALFYQALLADHAGEGPGLWQPAVLADAWRIRNPELVDPMTGQPALRGLGIVVAGESGRLWRGFAETCSPRSIGHMGAGGQIAWADPATGLSFAFLTCGADRDPARQGGRGLRLSTLAAACVSNPSWVPAARTPAG